MWCDCPASAAVRYRAALRRRSREGRRAIAGRYSILTTWSGGGAQFGINSERPMKLGIGVYEWCISSALALFRCGTFPSGCVRGGGGHTRDRNMNTQESVLMRGLVGDV